MSSTSLPSSWRRRIAIASLAVAGLAISSCLAAYQLHAIGAIWDPLFGDGSRRVLDSSISLQFRALTGIPDALFGAVAYFAEALLALIGSSERSSTHPWLVILFGLDAIPLAGGSIVLVILQAFVIRAFCTLCLCSAIASLLIAWLAHEEVIAAVRRVWPS